MSFYEYFLMDYYCYNRGFWTIFSSRTFLMTAKALIVDFKDFFKDPQMYDPTFKDNNISTTITVITVFYNGVGWKDYQN